MENITSSSEKDQNYLINAREAAKRLGVSRSMIFKLVQNGELPAVRIGSAIRIRPQCLNDFVESHLINEVK